MTDMNLLIATGTGAAYIISVAATFLDLGEAYKHTYYDTAALLITFIVLGRYLEVQLLHPAHISQKGAGEQAQVQVPGVHPLPGYYLVYYLLPGVLGRYELHDIFFVHKTNA